MIDKNGPDEFELSCDHCEEPADETFESFQEAVQFKKDNGWKSVKDVDEQWHDLRPDCQDPEIVRKVRANQE
jgi:hypothetical protein